jgi:hypothetical protein
LGKGSQIGFRLVFLKERVFGQEDLVRATRHQRIAEVASAAAQNSRLHTAIARVRQAPSCAQDFQRHL